MKGNLEISIAKTYIFGLQVSGARVIFVEDNFQGGEVTALGWRPG